MGSEELISNLDYLRSENELDEYVEQFYFFLATAVQQQDAKLIHHLLLDYVREVFYFDNRVRLYRLMKAAVPLMNEPQNRQYCPLFYLILGNVFLFAMDVEKSGEYYKKAISVAAEVKDFQVLSVALNNSITKIENFEPAEEMRLTVMPSVLMGMSNAKVKRKQYMLLIRPIEVAIDTGHYDEAQRLFHELKERVSECGLIMREVQQIELLELRLYTRTKQYDAFLAKLAELETGDLVFQYDLQAVMIDYALEVAHELQDDALRAKYTALGEQMEEQRLNTVKKTNRYSSNVEELMKFMIPFELLNKKAKRHVERGKLSMYSVVLFHIEQQELSDDEVKSLQQDIHRKLLPNLRSSLFGCTMVSTCKALYVFKQTEAQIIDYLQQHVKPVISAHRQALQKDFCFIISYVQNDLYGYETFEQTLQYAYALVYYARYNGKEALLNV